MPEMLAVGLEAAAALLALSAALALAGYAPVRWLAPAALRPYAWLILPAVGAAVLILGSYYLNLLVDMRVASALLLGAGTAATAWTIARKGWGLPRPTRSQWVVIASAAALLIVAFLPHLHGRSPAMLGLNTDEDLYVPLAELLKLDTVFMRDAALGPFQDEFRSLTNHSRGWGFPYLLSLTSIISNEPAFHAYVPTLYLLLALSVGTVFVFGRTALGVSERTAALGAVLYALHGLPLWFSGMGFGPHTVSFLLMPLAVTTGVLAIREGGARRLVFAAIASAALLVSYFWAISAVYLVVSVALAATLVLWGGGRRGRLVNLLALGVGIAVLGAPGLTWLLLWVLPQLTSITRDLNAQFGNAWGDIEYARVELAFGLAPYRLAADAGPLGAGPAEAARRVGDVLFWPVLGLALVGVATLRGNRVVAIPIALAYGAFMWWVTAVAAYPYGHFKNLSYVAYLAVMLVASGISNVYHAQFALWSKTWTARLSGSLSALRPGLRAAGVAAAVLVGLALTYNTYQTVWWYWSGVGWNVPRRIAHDARAVAERVPPGSRVYFGADLDYPVPLQRVVLREHVLAFHTPEHHRERWGARARTVWIGLLPGRDVYGFGATLAFPHEEHYPDEAYDFLVLATRDDARTYGLVDGDAVYRSPYWTVYRVVDHERLTANAIADANGGRLTVPATQALRFGLREGKLALGADATDLDAPLLLGAVTAGPAGLELRADGATETLKLEPGLTWITVGPATGSAVEVRRESLESTVQLVAARRLPQSDPTATQLEHVVRNLLSVDVYIDADVIHATLISVNPSGAGPAIGQTYHEIGTRGFWPSGALVAHPAQRIEIVYNPQTRELRERVNEGAELASLARPADSVGLRRLDARMSHGYIKDFGARLVTYQLIDGEIVSALPFRRAHVFDLDSDS